MTNAQAPSQHTDAEQHGLKQALEHVSERVAELHAYARHLGQVQLDLFEVRVQRTADRVAWRVFSALAFTVLVSALLLYCVHAGACGLAAWASWPVWGGQLAVGAVALLALLIAGLAWSVGSQRARLRRRKGKYDERKRAQRERFGRDVESAAASTN